MAYATTSDLADLIGEAAVPANAGLLLTRASREIDQALLCAVYATDDNGNPTDADLIAAFRDATCEVVCYWLAQGLTDGYPTGYQQVSIGSLSLSRGQGSSGAAAGTQTSMGPQAWAILQRAQITGYEPLAY